LAKNSESLSPYHVSVNKSVALVLSFLLVGLTCGVIGELLGFLRGFRRAGHPSAESMANSVFRAAQEGRFDAITTDKLASQEVVDSHRESNGTKGAIKSWRVLGSHSGPVGLPVVVRVEVQRRQREEESLIIHSPFRFHQHGGRIPVAGG
jgi:hypothetical protein